ncbi:carboxymuconolactone decarboxylase family protein [Scytonema sp. PRP1]|uniref:carboxymuconolactone decarboxylase family protein n=1 Tax=Scytonema sp. PRP1 TaxID=3120513 RepID=UPI002FCFEBDA
MFVSSTTTFLPRSFPLLKLEKYLAASRLSKTLLELIKIRASQINGCIFCIDMHTKDATHHGETEQQIYALNAWRETPFFTPEERASCVGIHRSSNPDLKQPRSR